MAEQEKKRAIDKNKREREPETTRTKEKTYIARDRDRIKRERPPSLPICIVPALLCRFRRALSFSLPCPSTPSIGSCVLPVVIPRFPAISGAVFVVGRCLRPPVIPAVRALLLCGRVVSDGPAVAAGRQLDHR